MIFVGDLTFPFEESAGVVKNAPKEFQAESKIANIESSVLVDGISTSKKLLGISLHSGKGIFNFCNEMNIIGGNIANNHITDYNVSIDNQKKVFSENGVQLFGAGDTVGSAEVPYICKKEKIVVLAFGWSGIGCVYATKNRAGVNPFEYDHVSTEIKKYKEEYPDFNLLVTIHWNYEFERYPQPADREFCHFLINNGVDAVFGHHPHIIQGFEIYKKKPIFYSLGNFYLPQINYAGHKLNYPDEALTGLAVRYNREIDGLNIFYVRQTRDGSQIDIESMGHPLDVPELMRKSEFTALNLAEYVKFFKKNRAKRKLLPVFISMSNQGAYKIKLRLLRARQIMVELVAKARKALLQK